MAKKNEIKEEVKTETPVLTPPVLSERAELEIVYKFLKDRGLNSIGDLENKIAKL